MQSFLRFTTIVSLLVGVFILSTATSQAAPVQVRFTEGMVRGFLVLGDAKGGRLGAGDFLQVAKEGEVRARTLLHLKDGSVHDETAVFTQHHVFVLQSYHLIQKGPSFKDDMDVTIDREKDRTEGKYHIRIKSRKDGKEKVLEGKIDLPLDVYNGMVPTVGKNLEKGAGATVHMVAYTPTPRVIELDMVPSGEEKVYVGDLAKTVSHYVLKPKLGLLRIPAVLLGRTPPDDHLWSMLSDVPAFVRFQGPLQTDGPVWQIELTSPVWPK